MLFKMSNQNIDIQNTNNNLLTKNISVIALIVLYGFEVRTFIGGIIPIGIITSAIIVVLLFTFFILLKYSRDNNTDIYTFDAFVWLFLFLYGSRMFYNIFIEKIPQGNFENRNTFIVYYLFLCILPYILSRRIPYNELRIQQFLLSLAIIFFIGLVLSAKQAILLVATESIYKDARFGANELLDTIAYGHLALSFVITLFSIFVLLKSNWKFLLILPIVFGLISMGIANSRSPFVSLIVILLVYLSSKIKFKTILIFGLVLILLISNLNLINEFFKNYFESSFVERFLTIFEFDVHNSSDRDVLYIEGLKMIKEYPFFGHSIFLLGTETAGLYPHNVFIEVLMSIGIFGSLIFFYVSYYALKYSYYIIKNRSNYSFFALIYIQYFVYLQFSRTIMVIPIYWVSLGTVFSIYLLERKRLENSIL